MKIAVTGKGGVGKTTIAATLARLYAAEGRKVLAADVDPDANLGLALGFSEEELDSIVPISKMRKLVEERTEATPDNRFYKLNPKVDDIPEKYGRTCNGVKLLVLGTVETAKEAERSIVDIETLQHTNQQLISTLDEVMNIQREGAQKRKAAEQELGRIEGELKQKLLELRG